MNRININRILTALILTLVLFGTEYAFSQKATDGFGVMVNLETGSYALEADKLYRFSPSGAAGYFSNTFTGRVECVDSRGNDCTGTTPPAPPAPDVTQTLQTAESQACTFLAGGSLQGASYTKTVRTGASKLIRNYTYYYEVAPTIGFASPLSGWDFLEDQPNSNGIASITLNGEIANQQVKPLARGKYSYSFPMIVNGAQLLTDLKFFVNDQPAPIWIENIQNCAGCAAGQAFSWDFAFTPNAGLSGKLSAAITSGDARTILNTDADPLNDDGGLMGTLLQETLLKPEPLSLPAGDHAVKVSGTSAGISFSTTKTLRVMTSACAAGR